MRFLKSLRRSLDVVLDAWASDSRGRVRDWGSMVERSGLDVVETPRWSLFPHLTARSGPLEVRLAEEGGTVVVAVKIQGPPDLADVMISRESFKLPGTREIEVGEPIFDSAFLVKGWLPFVCALLDEQVRFLLLRLGDEGGLTFVSGELRLDVPEQRLAVAGPLLLDLARRLASSRDIPRCLAENVRSDPSPGVRRRSLLVLLEDFPDYPSTVEALRAGSKDADPEIRLRAAQSLGDEGHTALLSLAENVNDDALSARAVAALGSALPFRRGRTLLLRSLDQGRTATAGACLEALGSLGGVAVATLAEVMARQGTELALLAAQALGATGDSAAEPALVEALARDDPALQVAAAKALGRVGSVDAVPPLEEAAGRSPFGGELRRATRQAVAEIQGRLQGAAPGRLSLASTEAGQLSLAPGEAGQLSLPAEEDD